MCSRMVLNSGSRFSLSGRSPLAGCSVDARPALPEAKIVGKSRTASTSRSGTSSDRSLASPKSRSWVSSMTSSIRASGRSVLLTTTMTGNLAARALRRTKRVCGNGPSEASTSNTTPSTMDRPRSTSPPKSACPGVSTTLMMMGLPCADGPLYNTEVFLARIVIPFSFSRSPESITRSE